MNQQPITRARASRRWRAYRGSTAVTFLFLQSFHLPCRVCVIFAPAVDQRSPLLTPTMSQDTFPNDEGLGLTVPVSPLLEEFACPICVSSSSSEDCLLAFSHTAAIGR